MKTNLIGTAHSICRRFCGALKAFVIGVAIALTGAAWGHTQKVGQQTWTYDLVVAGSDIVAKVQGVTPVTAEQLTIPSTLGSYPVRIIASNAFKSQIWSGVTIPSSVTNIEASAFYGCSYMTGSLTIPANVIRIGNSAFAGCNGLTSLTIKDGVQTIAWEAFRACSSLTTVSIPDSVTTIGSDAFKSCDNLRKADVLGSTFDGSLTKDKAFSGTASNFSLVFRETVGGVTFYYTVNSGNATIENGGEKAIKPANTANVTIPATLGGHTVTAIGDSAFMYCNTLTSVTLPNGLMGVGSHAFDSCVRLASITFPDTVVMIGNGAFRNCDALTSVDLNKAGLVIGESAFADCDKLATVKFPDAIIASGLGKYVLANCSSLASVTAPADSLAALMDNEVFKNCPTTAKYRFPGKTTVNGVTLTYIYVPGDGIQIGDGENTAVPENTSGTIDIPSSLTVGGYGTYYVRTIATNAFSYCLKITGVTIPNTVKTIDQGAFIGAHLQSVTIPDSVTTIGRGAFSGTYITTVTVPSSVRSLGRSVFQNCDNLLSVTLGAGVTEIPMDAFKYCDNLSSVSYINNANAVTNIGANAFEGCKSLTKFTTTKSFTTLGNSAFKNCTSLKFITLPEDGFYPELYTNTARRESIFENCPLDLEIAFFPSDSSSNERGSLIGGIVWGYTIVDGKVCLGSPTASPVPCIYPAPTGTAHGMSSLISIPLTLGGKAVTEIGNCAFKGCTGIGALFIPSTVTKIHPNAFEGCTGLNGVMLPKGLQEINQYAFKGCTGFTTVVIPDSVTSLGYAAFADCSNLQSASLSATLFENNINYTTTFSNCHEDFYVVYRMGSGYAQRVDGVNWRFTISDGEATVVSGKKAGSPETDLSGNVTIPAKLGGVPVTAIKEFAFRDLTAVTGITLPSTLKTIGDYAFQNTGLTTITIPESVTKISDAAFQSCTALADVTLPSGLTKINDCTFQDCTSLENVYSGDKIKTIGSQAFSGCTSLSEINLIIRSAQTIDVRAFWGCDIRDMRVADTTTTIENYAFGNCGGLLAASLPGTFAGVLDEFYVFSGCPADLKVTYRFDDGRYAATVYQDTWYYTLDGSGNATIVGLTLGSSIYTAQIPSSLNGHPVKAIGDGAFAGNTKMIGASIPDSVTSIGAGAFSGCSNLGSVSIRQGMLSIGERAFENCVDLVDATIPDSVTTLGNYAFSGCTSLKTASMLEKLWRGLENGTVFAGCKSSLVVTYRKIDGEAMVLTQKIGDNIWYFLPVGDGSVKLYSVSEYLPDDIFIAVLPVPSGILTLPSELGGKSVSVIGKWAFRNCTGITSVTIPRSVTKIETEAFLGCTGLTSVAIPDSVTTIQDYAFKNCSNLLNVSLPSSFNGSLESNVFAGCAAGINIRYRGDSGTTSVVDDGKTWTYQVLDEVLLTARLVSADGNSAVMPAPTGTLTIPSTIDGYTIVEIGEKAFNKCSGLTKVILPSDVTTIGKLAFAETGLTELTLPSGLTTIKQEAFYNCAALATVVFPEGLTRIENGVFNRCGVLGNVTLPESLTYIGDNAFRSCYALTAFTIPANVSYLGENSLNGCSAITSLNIGSEAIFDESSLALYNAFGTTRKYVAMSVTLAPGMTTIANGAFQEFEKMTSISIPDTVTKIEDFAFMDCASLAGIAIPDSVTEIGKYAFTRCYELRSVTLPVGLTTISYYMLSGAGITSLTIPDGVTTIGTNAISYCNGNSAWELPLTSVYLPDGVVTIMEGAFYADYSLAEVRIPSSVTSIEHDAFRNCDELNTVRVSANDTARVKALLVASGLTEEYVNGLTFVEEDPDFWSVSFDPNGGMGSIVIREVAPGAELGALPEATRGDEYSFLGWFTEAEGGSPISATTKATADVTYYAHWSLKKYSVAIDTGTGSPVPVDVVHGTTIGDVLETITQPTRDGYTFKGWVDADDEPLDLLAPVTADTTFIAVWAKNVHVNAYTCLDGEVQATPVWGEDCAEGDELLLSPLKVDGYVFQGWSTEADGELLLTDYIIVTEGLALYAQFTLDTWTVTFDANGGDCDTASVRVVKGNKLDSVLSSLPEATRTGYKFGGWWTTADGGEEVYADWTDIDSDVTFYAHWRNVANFDSYEYEYEIADGVAVIHEKDGQIAVTPSPSGKFEIPAYLNGLPVGKIGHGAFNNLGITEVVIPEGVTEIGSEAFGWCSSLATVTIPSSVTKIGEDAFDMCTLLKTVNVALGDTDRIKALLISSGLSTLFVNGLTFVEAEAPKWTVTLDPNGGTVDPTSVEVADGAKVSTLLPTPTYPGFSFVGWFTAADGGDAVTAETTVTADVTYYAHWSALTAYTVTLDANGGSVTPDSILVYAGEKVGTLPTPEKEDYRFTGWTKDGSPVTADTVVNANMTIVAQWEAIYTPSEFTVTFDANGGDCATTSIKVTEGQKVGAALPSASRTGYEFVGWKVTNEFWVDENTVVTEDIACTAQWLPKQYTVTYDANGGTIGGAATATCQYNYDSSYSHLSVDERSGWAFLGWFTSATGNKQVLDGETVKILSDTTLYAHWEESGTPPPPPPTTWTDPETGLTWDYKLTADGEGIEIYKDGGWYMVTPKPTGVVTIPATIDGKPVTVIGTTAFAGCEDLTYVVIPDTVTEIGEWAFAQSGLTGVDLPDGLETIGNNAFYDCDDLTSIEIPSGVTTIGEGAFQNCSGLTEVTIPASVTDIGSDAFSGTTIDTVHVEPGTGTTVLDMLDGAGCDTTGVEVKEDAGTATTTYYTVVFNALGGACAETTRKVAEGAKVGALPSVTLEGYDFWGWGTTIDGGVDVDADTVVTGNVTYYAQLEGKQFGVTLDANGGVFAPSTSSTRLFSATYGQPYGNELKTPTKEGYAFAGWFTALEDGDRVTADTVMTRLESHTLYAHWTESTSVTVTLELNGGSGVETSLAVEVGDQIGILPIPEGPEGRNNFKGWFWDAEFTQAVKPTDVVTANCTCYAKWNYSIDLMTTMVDGIAWTYFISGSNKITLYNNGRPVVPSDYTGFLQIPAKIGGKTVEGIGERAFYGCTALTSVIIPDGVTAIYDEAFAWCARLQVVQFGKGIAKTGTIFYRAFEGCEMLKVLDFKGSEPPTAGDDAFMNAGSKTDWGVPQAYVPKNAKGWSAIWLPFGIRVNNYSYNAHILVEFKEMAEATIAGKLSYSGGLEIGKTFTLKATANKGWVFAGWWDKDTGERCSRAVSYPYFVTGEDRNFQGDFVRDFEDNVLKVTLSDYTTDGNGWIMIDLGAATESYSDPKFTVKGLPSGLKYDAKTQKISGTATKPGRYKVTVTATNTTVKKPTADSTAEFTLTVPNFTDAEIPVADEYGPFIPGEEIAPVTLAEAAGCKVSGLPTGMKWTEKFMTDSKTKMPIPAYSFYGTPTKPGSYTVYFTKTTVDKVKHTATATFTVAPLRQLMIVMSGNSGKDKATGAGSYAMNAKVSLKATADKGKVFSCWIDNSTGEIISRAASCTYLMSREDNTITAVFTTTAEDAKHLATSVGDFADYDQNEIMTLPNAVWNQTTNMAGVYVEWPVTADTVSFATIKVSGLPAGLKFTAKDIVDSKTKLVTVPANTIYGTPTTPSKPSKTHAGLLDPSIVKITVTTAGKTTANYQLDVFIKAMEPWSYGTFDGGGDAGQATFTIANTGKISGKYLDVAGNTWTLTAASFEELDSVETPTFYGAMLQGKAGKVERTFALTVEPGEDLELGGITTTFGVATLYDVSEGMPVVVAMLTQNHWKEDPWKQLAAPFKNAAELGFYASATEFGGYDSTDGTIDYVSLKFANTGVVTAKGSFTDKTGKAYSASGTAVLLPFEIYDAQGSFGAYVYIYFPPKAGKFDGYVKAKYLRWEAAPYNSFRLTPYVAP